MKLLQFPLGQFNTISINKDNTNLIVGGTNLQIYDMNQLIEYAELNPPPKLHQLTSITPISTITCHTDSINNVQYFHNTDEFISTDISGYIYHHTTTHTTAHATTATTTTTTKQIFPFGNKPTVAIVDISISADDNLLAWSTTTGEINLYSFTSKTFQKLSCSSSTIQRSISFDPTNNYLLTIGDDTLIHVYQYTSTPYKFRHITKISSLLNKNRKNVQYKRISWSPEGELLAIPTASKNQTLVISLISHSNNWNTSISLVGHDSTCQVVRFNPKLFKDKEDSIYSVVASGDGEGNICVWNTTKDSPIVVLKKVGDDIKDMCWVNSNVLVWCGRQSVYVGKFEQSELGIVVDNQVFEKLTDLQKSLVKDITHKYDDGSSSKRVKEITYIEEINGIDITQTQTVSDKIDVQQEVPITTTESTKSKGKITPTVIPPPDNPIATTTTTPPSQDILDSAMTTRKSTPKKVKPVSQPSQVITMKNGKRRIQPVLISTTNPPPPKKTTTTTSTTTPNKITSTTSMEFDKPSTVISIDHLKKRPTIDPPNKKRQQLEPIKFIGTPIINPTIAISKIRLATPKIPLHFQTNSSELILDVKNGSGNETQPTRITCIKREKPIWTDFIAKHVGLVTSGDNFFAVALADGNIVIYSQISGIRLFPTLVLGSPISFLESCQQYLMCVTNVGELFVWDIQTKKSILNTTITPLLDLGRYDDDGLSKSDHITLCAITTKGIPLITLSNGNGYMYNSLLGIWQTVSESWWCFGSHYWNSTTTNINSIIDMLEHHTNEEISRKTRSGRGKLFNKISKNMIMKEGFESLENTISINHLENRIKCAEILGESEEFKKWFIIYVERLCELGLKVRLFEVCSELMGPTSKEPKTTEVNGTTHSTTSWTPTICGWDKQTLLKEIISTCSIHRDAQRVLIYFGEQIGLV